MWEECVDILKWQWENNEALLIGGWEKHRDVASRCSWGPRGHERLPIWWRIHRRATGKNRQGWLWTAPRHRNSEACFGFLPPYRSRHRGPSRGLQFLFCFFLHLPQSKALMHMMSPEFISVGHGLFSMFGRWEPIYPAWYFINKGSEYESNTKSYSWCRTGGKNQFSLRIYFNTSLASIRDFYFGLECGTTGDQQTDINAE